MGSGDSGSNAYKTSALLMELYPYPQPHFIFLFLDAIIPIV